MKREDDASENPFIKFKKHIDSYVCTGICTILGSNGTSRPSEQAASPLAIPQASLNMEPSPSQPEQTAQPQQALALMSVTLEDAYNPLALRHLPQPKPTDCPSSYDASIFTFQDAFEDLLAVTQGRDLMPIDARYVMRMLLDQMYPSGEPDFLWHLRLQRQGLMPERKFPRSTMRLETEQDGELSQLMGQLDRVASKVWKTASEDLDKEGLAFWGNVDAAMKSLLKTASDGLEREGSALWDNVNAAAESLLGGNDSASSRKREPRHFDDLFSAVESDTAERDSSWDTFMKAITEGSKSKDTTEKTAPKKVTETDEYTDRLGWQHRKNTTRTLDSEGKEIGKETYWTITSRNHIPAKPVEVSPQDRVEDRPSRPDPQLFAKLEPAEEETRDVETRDEYVDRFGYLHTTTTLKTLDRDGKEISRSTSVTIRPAGQAGQYSFTRDGESDGEQKIGDGTKVYSDHGKVHKKGWFWK